MTRQPIPLGVQLFTLRKELAVDRPGTLKRVAEIGYSGVELAPTDWPDINEMRAILEETGLTLISSHVPFVRLRDEFDSVSEYCHALGIADLVVPSIPGPVYEDEAELRRAVDEIAGIARQCKQAGFRCSYHNHGTEFRNRIAGQEVYDFIFETIGGDLLQAQIDTFFIEEAGKSPAEYVRRYAGRVPLLHLKDQSKQLGGLQTEIGQGTIDWKDVLSAANEAGVEWLIVEQNCGDRSGLESIGISYEFLKSLGAV